MKKTKAVAVTVSDGRRVILTELLPRELLAALATEGGDGSGNMLRAIGAAVRVAIVKIDEEPIRYGDLARDLSEAFPRMADRSRLRAAFLMLTSPPDGLAAKIAASAAYDSGANAYKITIPETDHPVEVPERLRGELVLADPSDRAMAEVLDAADSRKSQAAGMFATNLAICAAFFGGADDLPAWVVTLLGDVWSHLFVSGEAATDGADPFEVLDL